MTTLLGYVRTIISIQWSKFSLFKGNRCGSLNGVYSNGFLGWWSSNMATLDGWIWRATFRRHCCLSPSGTKALWGCAVSAPLGCEIKQFNARQTFGSHFWVTDISVDGNTRPPSCEIILIAPLRYRPISLI